MTPASEPPPTQPDEPRLLMDAALSVVREHGAKNITVDDVLERAALGTRAFYRHFSSKNHLVVEVFARAADEEAARVRTRMAAARDPLGAVVAWIDCRLDLGFDPNVRSDLKYLSEQAQGLYAIAPVAMEQSFAAMLAPLVEALADWPVDGDPRSDAAAIHSVVWGVVQQQWAAGSATLRVVRPQILTFCLLGIGATADDVASAISTQRPRQRKA